MAAPGMLKRLSKHPSSRLTSAAIGVRATLTTSSLDVAVDGHEPRDAALAEVSARKLKVGVGAPDRSIAPRARAALAFNVRAPLAPNQESVSDGAWRSDSADAETG